MRYLLDSHTFIWLDISPKKLSSTVRAVIDDDANQIYLSMTSVWELQVKQTIGKLQLNNGLRQTVTNQRSVNRIALLPITLDHIYRLDGLPMIHRDAFDRLLIAQALHESLTLLSRDPVFAQYPVSVLW